MAFLEYHTKLKQYVPSLAPEQAEDYVNQAWRDIREANEEWSFLYAQEFWLAPDQITLTGLTVTQFSPTVILTHANLVQIANQTNPPLTQRQIRFGLTGGPIYSIDAADVQQVFDGAITAATDDLVCTPSAPFSVTDEGKKIRVAGAGPGGGNFDTTILTFISTTNVTLAANASTTVGPSATVTFGSSLTLDRMYTEDSSSTATGLIYRIYYSPLSTDFQRLDHLIDPIRGYSFGHTVRPIFELDRADPRRSSFSEPKFVFFREFDTATGLPVYELWPAPTSRRAYPAAFWRLGTDFVSDDDALPPQIPEELLLVRARMLAYEFAMSTNDDARRRQTYQSALSYVRGRYSTEGRPGAALGLLEKTKRRDKSVYAKMFLSRPMASFTGWPPIDSRFFQNHGLPAL